jgi:hypothetical protein
MLLQYYKKKREERISSAPEEVVDLEGSQKQTRGESLDQTPIPAE